jgi:hypothetical protein
MREIPGHQGRHVPVSRDLEEGEIGGVRQRDTERRCRHVEAEVPNMVKNLRHLRARKAEPRPSEDVGVFEQDSVVEHRLQLPDQDAIENATGRAAR